MTVVQGVQNNLQSLNERSIQNDFFGMSAQEVTCFVLRSLGVIAGTTGIVLVGLTVFEIVAWPIALFAIPCALVAVGFFWGSRKFFDYENPEAIEKYRQDAMYKPLDQIATEHGWTNLIRHGILLPEQFAAKYREQVANMNLKENIDYYEKVLQRLNECPHRKFEYQIPHPSEWRGLWRQETRSKTFEEIITSYSIENLEKYSLLEIGELNRIKMLKGNYDSIKRQYAIDIAPVMRRFEAGTSEFKRAYDRSCASEDHTYNTHCAVVELLDFEQKVTEERLKVQTDANQSKLNAQTQFEQRAAALTNQGKKPVSSLSPEELKMYNCYQRELECAKSLADDERRQQIAQIDARAQAKKERLTHAKREAEQTRDKAHAEAKRIYDAASAPFCLARDAELAPFNRALQLALNDLTDRYRVYTHD